VFYVARTREKREAGLKGGRMTQIEWYINSLKKEMQEKCGQVFKVFDARFTKPEDMKKIRTCYREAGKRLGVRIHTKKLGDKVIISTKNYKGHKYVTDYVHFDDGAVWKVKTLFN